MRQSSKRRLKSIHHISSDLRSGCFADEANNAIAYWWYKPRGKRLTVQVKRSRTSLSLYQYEVETLLPQVAAWHLIELSHQLANMIGAALGECRFAHPILPPADFSGDRLVIR